jgi:hypothetical protein
VGRFGLEHNRVNFKSFLFTLALSSQSVFAQSVEELVQKNIQARGGRERLLSLRSLHFEGRLLSGSEGNLEMKQQVYVESPNHYRSEYTLQGMTAVSAFDGEQGWRISPFGGRKDPEKMSPEESKSMQWATDLSGPLVDYAAKGHKLEYLGREDVDGSDTYVLRLTRASGDSETFYLDPDTFLEIRVARKTLTRGVEREVETDLGNYALVEGCYLPFSLESGSRGGARTSRVSWDRIEANVPMKSELFQFPGGPRE